MTRTDSLLSAVDALIQRLDAVVRLFDDLSRLVWRLLELNLTISHADAEIDAMTRLVNSNNLCLNELERLREKLHFSQPHVLLEPDFERLAAAFKAQNEPYKTEEVLEPEPQLNSVVSVSNLHLKPLRCRRTVDKRKSRYRISAAYTLNPLAPRQVSQLSSESIFDEYPTSFDSVSSEDGEESPKAFNMEPLHISDVDMDALSDELPFEDFSLFLRQLRVDLRGSFPTVEAPTAEQSHAEFVNPFDFVNKRSVCEPTVLSETQQPILLYLKFTDHSKKFLEPKKHTFFNLLNLPLGLPRLPERRKSTGEIGVNIESTLLEIAESPPARIKKLRKGLLDPIQIPNESRSRRLPVERLNGGHSQLTIGPNRTKIVRHGQNSLFKKPPVRKMSVALLHEALNESLLF